MVDDAGNPREPRTWRRISTIVFCIYGAIGVAVLGVVVLGFLMFSGACGNMGAL